MSDDKPNFVSKDDLQVLIASFEQKMQDREDNFMKMLEKKENQIHSSYLQKMKKAGLEVTPSTEEDESTPARKPTKRELELQDNLEKLLKEMEDTKARTKAAEMRTKVNDTFLKSGINPKAVDSLYTLLNARGALSEDETGSLRMKVDVEGNASVALPLADALKRYVQSDEGQLFLAPLGTSGSGAKTPTAPKTAPEAAPKPKVALRPQDIDWGNTGDTTGIYDAMKRD